MVFCRFSANAIQGSILIFKRIQHFKLEKVKSFPEFGFRKAFLKNYFLSTVT
ncbi:hypothetical protein C943_01812 [Mariniradius saccharolyticus AK6]|uniref:Uncharacterized protein n=1 Tax=Mariniradius saccharolyticus AK6 TaxID=1239962 RepID=M7XB85_9BACT|nr:hypothetical protein C943_01812 [Mariniradius saccharolyticus AK6]